MITNPLPLNMLQVITSLGGEVYLVGGCVRDSLLDVANNDVDLLVCGMPMPMLIGVCGNFGKVELVGQSFGVIKFTPPDGQTIDIALPRTETSTGQGHTEFDVVSDYTLPVETDLARRDFTINAIAVKLSDGSIIDPFGGMADIQSRTLRMIGPQAFPDDPLRIRRGVQFAARFNLTVDPTTLLAMREHAPSVSTIAPERVAYELEKLLTKAGKPSVGFRLMQVTGVLAILLPEIEAMVGCTQEGTKHVFDVFNHTMYAVDTAPADMTIRLAALFHDVGKPSTKSIDPKDSGRVHFYGHEEVSGRMVPSILDRLRFSSKMAEDVSVLVREHMYSVLGGPKSQRKLVQRVGVERIDSLMALKVADAIAHDPNKSIDKVHEFNAQVSAMLTAGPVVVSPRGLAINGRDLMSELGMSVGPMIGQTLKYLVEHVVDDPSLNTREQLIKIARMYMESLPRP